MTNTGIIHGTNRYLDLVNDSAAGSLFAVGSGQDYPGQLGAVMNLNAAEALKFSSVLPVALTNVGTLYAGRYQYVKFYVSQSGTTVGGGPVYWQDPDNFVVSADVATGNLGFAGVALNLVTKGYCGWILTRGKCLCQPLDNTTKGSPAVGDVMILSTIGRFDDVDDPYATGAPAALPVGQWITAPVDATSTLYPAYVRGAVLIG